ncbi:MAG: serine/threonine-protein kinase [Candidatus Sumerlaeia bacterium]|nr:serine/threonine-protein kinase [Candidatus Sumerlaeia bacterium]
MMENTSGESYVTLDPRLPRESDSRVPDGSSETVAAPVGALRSGANGSANGSSRRSANDSGMYHMESGEYATEELVRSTNPFPFVRGIGKGGYGDVFEGTQAPLKRSVAVKRLREDLLRRASAKPWMRAELEAVFRHEALILAQLEHPAIVAVHELAEDPRHGPTLALKLVQGMNWEEMILEDMQRLPEAEYYRKHLGILAQVLQALAFAHSKGIIHRDVKPAQVVVGKFGEVQLMDWGLALVFNPAALPREVTEALKELSELSSTGSSTAGTPAFMAPEQATGGKLGPWTDVFLVGATIYFILTGTAPFRSKSPARAIELASECAPEHPRERAPGRRVTDELCDLALLLMAKDPAARRLSMEGIAFLLRDHLANTHKRMQSQDITATIAARLAHAPDNYRDLGEIVAELDRAKTLWEGNPDAASLREGALQRTAEAALRNGDLEMARLQTRRLAPGPARAAIEARLASALKALETRRRHHGLLQIAMAAVLLAIVVQSVLMAGDLKLLDDTRDRYFRLEQLRGEIRFLDEALTMSAKMAAERGDSVWAQRYRQLEPRMDAALDEALSLVPSDFHDDMATVASLSGELTAMEVAALDASAGGRLAEARDHVESERYAQTKRRLLGALGETEAHLRSSLDARVAEARDSARRSALGIGAMLLLLAGLWIPGFAATRRGTTATASAMAPSLPT